MAGHKNKKTLHGEPVPHGPGVGHVAPRSALIAVWSALMVFTVLTVAVTFVNLGPFNIWIAMGIATIKASLVALYFMHLRYDRPINAIVFVTSLFFVMLFIGGALSDTFAYRDQMIPGYQPEMERPQ